LISAVKHISFILLLGYAFSFSYCQTEDPVYNKIKLKVDKKLSDKKYYAALKLSKVGLSKFKDDSYFNYTAAFSLFYSEKHKKVKQLYPTKNELTSATLELLDKAMPLDQFNKSFSLKLQRQLNKDVKDQLEKKQVGESIQLLNKWFSIFNNSKPYLKNNHSKEIQDSLFSKGNAYFKEKDRTTSDLIFDWMHKTFSSDDLELFYDPSSIYILEGYYFEEYRNPKYFLANTAKDASYLTETEKQVIFLHNLVRMDPQLFNSTYVTKYYELNRKGKTEHAKSLVSDLNELQKGWLLYPNETLHKAAKFHVEDNGTKGLRGHASSDGTSFGDRVRGFGFGGYIAENIDYQRTEPLDILMSLLIDEGVESKGHRTNILNEKYVQIGVAIGFHKSWDSFTVLDYANSRD
jgi:hypothetical protein